MRRTRALTRALGELAPATGAVGGQPTVLADRPDGTVIRIGDTVVKAHAPGTDAPALAVRLRLAAGPETAGILLPPLAPATVAALPDGRAATRWPYGTPVDPRDPDAAPWEAAGRLLARLHAVPEAVLTRRYGTLPPMRGPLKAAAAVARMRAAVPHGDGAGSGAHPLATARHAVERAWAALPAWCRAEEPPPARGPVALCHGDFHLGQLVRHPAADGPWRLIDVDDLGLGDPAWDLARPAAWFAAGVLPPDAWARLLGAYQESAGARGRDPWPRLDRPARALTVQCAAQGIARAAAAGREPDEDETAFVAACLRIAGLPGPAAP